MTVYETKNWKIEKIDIQQTHTSYKTEYFVDDKNGKNHRVFNNLEDAKRWIARR